MVEFLKSIIQNKKNFAVAAVCLFGLGIAMASAIMRDTYAGTTVAATFVYDYNTNSPVTESCFYDEVEKFNCQITAPKSTTGKGWGKSSTCTSGEVADGATVTIANDTTYYECSTSTSSTTTYTAIFKKDGVTVASKTCNLASGSSTCTVTTANSVSSYGNGWGTVSTCTPSTALSQSKSYVELDGNKTFYACRKRIVVTFNANGGTTPTSSLTYWQGSKYSTLPSPTNGSLHFGGWYNGSTKVSSSTTVATSNHTLTAQWNVKVTFNNGGGTCDESYRYVGVDSYVGTLPDCEKDGYEFKGWYNSDGSTRWLGTARFSSDTILYAKYEKNTYKVTFDPNGATGITAANGTYYDTSSGSSFYIEKSYGETIGDLPKATRSGYTFNGWYSGTTKISSSTTVTSSYTVKASWTQNTYTVTFYTNGGSLGSSPTNASVIPGGTYTSLPTPTKTGYTFDGWYTKNGMTSTTGTDWGVKKEKGDSVDATGNHYLYAKWSANSYKITTLANGGTIAPSTTAPSYGSAFYIKASKTVTITGNANGSGATVGKATSASQTFAGWTATSGLDGQTAMYGSSSSASSRWTDGSTKVGTSTTYFKNLTTKSGGTVALVANWTPVAVTLPTVTKSGYTCKWYENPSATGTSYSSGGKYTPSAKSSASVTMHAKCTKNSSSGGGGTTTPSSYTVTFNVKGGSAWNSATCTGTGITLSSTTCTKSVTSGSTYGTLPTPKRTGYVFDAWHTGGNAKITSSSKVAFASNHTLYAQWTANTYTVKYDGNGKTGGTTANSSHTYDVAKALTKNGYTKTDYTFKGWNTKADGTGINYTDGQSVKNLGSTSGEIVTLYAQWRANDSTEEETIINYSVEYNSNGGSGKMDNSSHRAGYASYLSTNTFTREGFEFVEWNTKADGSGTAYADGEMVSSLSSTNNATVVLYAQWIEVDPEIGGNEEIEIPEGGDEDTDTPGDNSGSGNSGDKGNGSNNNSGDGATIDKSPQTGALATILVSLIGIGAAGGIFYYRKKAKV